MKISGKLLFVEFVLGFVLIIIIVIARRILPNKKESVSRIEEIKKLFSFRPLYDLFILGLKESELRNKAYYLFLSLSGGILFISIIFLFLSTE